MEELLEEGLVGWLLVLSAMVGGALALHYFLGQRRRWTLASRIPGLQGLSWFGRLRLVFEGFSDAFEKMRKTPVSEGEVFKLWLGTRLFIFISNPADAELVLRSQDHIDKPAERDMLGPWLGDGLSACSGKKWKWHRRTVAPAFHPNVLTSYIPAFNRKSAASVARLREVGSQGVRRCLGDAVMEILLETVLGVESEEEKGSEEYAAAIRKLSDIVREREDKIWQRFDFAFNLLGNGKDQEKLLSVINIFTRKAIIKRKNEYIKHDHCFPDIENSYKDENGNVEKYVLNNNVDEHWTETGDLRRLTLLDLMLESWQDGDLLLIEVQNQIDSLMFESCKPLEVTLCNFLRVLADRSDVQEYCLSELRQIFGDSDRPVTFQDTIEMKYTERCLMETLRMYPPVPIIARELKQELKLASSNLTIPADSTVVIDVDKLHRRPDVYTRPEEFDPDNFLLENIASRHYYSFLPFSAGPRSCIGRKFSILCLKVFLTWVLRSYQVLPSKLQAPEVTSGKITDDFGVRLVPRKM